MKIIKIFSFIYMSAYKRFVDDITGFIGPTGPTGAGFDDISGVPPQLAYFNTPTELYGTPDAVTDIAPHQILFSDGLVGTPVISFQSDPDTGIYRGASDQLAISAAGTKECSVSTNHISADAGSAANPSYNFGITGTDTNTGTYLAAANIMGFSAGGSLGMQISDISHISISGGSLAIPALNFGLAGDTDVGIYNGGVPNAIAMVEGGGTLMVISTAEHISISGGTSTFPGYNFGIPDLDGLVTGMYRIDSSAVGFGVLAEQRVALYSENAGDFIEGLNVGTPSNIAGIRRLSSTASNSWEDGYLGNSSEIVFTCGDFTTSLSAGGGSTADFYMTAVNGASTMVGITWNTGVQLAATKVVPLGFRIPSGLFVNVYSPVSGGFNGTITCFQRNTIDIGSTGAGGTLLFGPAPALNFVNGISTHQLANTPVTSNGFLTVTILIVPSTTILISDGLLGASIPIERA